MKKLLSLLLATILCLTLFAGCGADPSSSAPQTSADAAPSGNSEPAQPSDGGMKAAMVTAQRLGDKGVTDLCNEGFQKACGEFGFDGRVVEVQKGEYEETLRALAEEKYDVIVVLWGELVDATQKVAPSYPDTRFISILGDMEMDNVQCALGREQDGSYLAGVMAAMTTETKHIGFIGGSDNPEINRFLAGYQQGAWSVDPDIKIDAVYVGSFEDPTKGKELASLLYNQGCDIVYAAAAKSGLGLFDAAEEMGKYAIGCDVDQNDLVPGQVICSMTINYGNWIYNGMKQISEDAFVPGVTWYSLDGDNLALVLPEASVRETPAEIVAAISDARGKIISGEITVDGAAVK